MAARRRKPQGLSTAGSALWASLTADFDLEPGDFELCEAAARTADDLARMGKALTESELVVAGSRGQLRPNPLIAEIRGHRVLLARLLRQIGQAVDDEHAA